MMNFILKFWLATFKQMLAPAYLGFGAKPELARFKAEQATADTAAGNYGGQAGTEGATLNPLFMQDIRATHLFNPNQTNELLTNAEAGSGGTFGGAEGVLNASAARTGNATGVAKTLDEMARDKSKADAASSEGVAAQDVLGAKQLNAQGAAGMQGLYGTNVGAQLGAMKQATEDVNGEMQAEGPGWLKSTLGTLADLGGAAGSIMGGYGKLKNG